MKVLILSVILGFLFFSAYATAPSLSSQLAKSFVAIDDIGSTVEVVGRLGIPLRKMTYFKAKWIPSTDRYKPESIPLRLKIIEVDNVVFERDVLFLPADVCFVDTVGKEMVKQELHGVIDLYGYEDWVPYGPPFEFEQAIGNPVVGAPEARGRSQLKAIVQSH